MSERLRDRVPEKIKVLYGYHMRHIKRWEGGSQKSAIPETDADHVVSMHALAEEIKEAYQNLTNELDWDSVTDMIDVHDGGEIGPGDLSRSDPHYESKVKNHKRRERLTFLFALRRIADPNLREDVLASYRRYMNFDPSDKEAAFVHLLDKVQALRFGLENVFMGTEENLVSREHVSLAVGLVLDFAKPLRKAAQGKARGDISAFVQLELGRVRSGGFPVVANEGRVKFLKPDRQITPFDHQIFPTQNASVVS